MMTHKPGCEDFWEYIFSNTIAGGNYNEKMERRQTGGKVDLERSMNLI